MNGIENYVRKIDFRKMFSTIFVESVSFHVSVDISAIIFTQVRVEWASMAGTREVDPTEVRYPTRGRGRLSPLHFAREHRQEQHLILFP